MTTRSEPRTQNPEPHKTPAKINLGLEILRKRDDGYHEINSVFIPIPLYDELSFELTAGAIVCTGPETGVPFDETNLCVRAATVLREEFGVDQGVHIVLDKHIPVGAGLGGGSSDAACTIQTLNDLWKIHAPLEELRRIAKRVGADVPFFLDPRPSIVRGIGERIEPLSVKVMFTLLVVCPDIAISTKWAYGQVVCDRDAAASDYSTMLSTLSLDSLSPVVRNDFERFIFPHHPELREIKERLIAAGATYASLSGSGSALFGLFQTAAVRDSAQAEFTNYRTFALAT